MLGKLLKYEFKSTSRVMWLLYLGLIGVALMLGIIVRVGDFTGITEYSSTYINMNNEAMNSVLRILLVFLGISYFLVLTAVMVITTVMIVLRFYRNILGDEGYLMHTLPVPTTHLLTSKLLISVIWMLLAGASAVVSGFVFMVSSGFLGFLIREGELIRVIKEVFEVLPWTTVILTLVSGLIGIVSSILLFYLSMAIGNMANKNKFLFSVLAYLGIQTVLSIVASIVMVLGGTALFEQVYEAETFFNTINITSIIINVLTAVGCFIATDWILKRRLNLA